MNLFADSMGELRYERGLVSMRLHSSTSPDPGLVMHLPFEDFRQIAMMFAGEMSAIEQVHRNWIAEEAGRHAAAVSEVPVEAKSMPKPGRKIASV